MYNIKDFNKYAKEYNEFIDMCRNRYFNIKDKIMYETRNECGSILFLCYDKNRIYENKIYNNI